MFGGNNFLLIDNNEYQDEKAAKRFGMLVKKGLGKFIRQPIKNKNGQGWVRHNKIIQGKDNVNII